MEFRDLKAQYQYMKKDIDTAIENVLTDADFISGKQVRELEEELSEYVGVKHCITCGNGTDALILALMAWNIGKGDAVFVPDFTFFASGEAPAFLGATPVFVDVERDTFNISVSSLEEAIIYVRDNTNLNPKVVIAVDLFGQPADYPKIQKLAKKYDLLILEDGAQGFGGAIGNKRACSFGDISTTSFFPAKPLGCYGDGGAVFTDNDDLAEVIRSLCIHGKGKDKYDNIRIGMNSRLDTIQAAILKVKFKHFIEHELEQVNQIAGWYAEKLKGIVDTPKIKKGFYSSWAQYTVVCKSKDEREKIQKTLKENEIPCAVYYSKGMHEQKAFKDNFSKYIKCDNTKYLSPRVLSLPMYAFIDQNEIFKCADVIKDI